MARSSFLYPCIRSPRSYNALDSSKRVSAGCSDDDGDDGGGIARASPLPKTRRFSILLPILVFDAIIAVATLTLPNEDDDKEEEEEELVDAFDELVAVVVPRRPHRRNAPCWWLPWFAHLVVAVVVDVDVDGVVDAIIFRFVFSLSFLTTTLGGGGGGAKDFCIPKKEKGENLFFLRPTIYTQKIFCSGNFFKVLFISQKRVWMMKDFFARRKCL